MIFNVVNKHKLKMFLTNNLNDDACAIHSDRYISAKTTVY